MQVNIIAHNLSNVVWQLCMWLVACHLLKSAPRLKSFFVSQLIGLLLFCPPTFIPALGRGTMVGVLLTILNVFLVLLLVFQVRGWRLAVFTVVGFGITIVMELAVLSLLVLSLGNDWVAANQPGYTWAFAGGVSVTLCACTAALNGLIWLVRHMHAVQKQSGTLTHLLRIPFMVLLFVLCLMLNSEMVHLLPASDQASWMMRSYALFALMALFVVSFILQDVHSLRQARHNETLAQKQQDINELLTGMRSFRHNIANLLYGMEGAMLSGDASEMREYYNQLIEKCTLINTENTAALQNLNHRPLSALILHKLSAAYDSRIPIYLYVEPGLSLRGLSKSDLCEVVGVLMDNALEAAKKSPAPYVSLELRSFERGTELVVRNSYSGAADDVIARIYAAKRGQAGLGLLSAYALLSRYPNAMLNLRTAGRYVEAQVLAQ